MNPKPTATDAYLARASSRTRPSILGCWWRFEPGLQQRCKC